MRISDWSSDVCSSDLVRIDDGACRALAERGASLLPGGVVGVEGDFSNHALVDLVSRQGRRIGRGLVEYHASDLQRIAGRHSQEIEDVLGFHNGNAVVRRDNRVLLDQVAAVRSEEHTLNSSHQCASRMTVSTRNKKKNS